MSVSGKGSIDVTRFKSHTRTEDRNKIVASRLISDDLLEVQEVIHAGDGADIPRLDRTVL